MMFDVSSMWRVVVQRGEHEEPGGSFLVVEHTATALYSTVRVFASGLQK